MIEEIIKSKQGQDALIAIDEILYPIYTSDPSKLTVEELNFCYIEELEREINSGGFNRYFYYSAGNYAVETIHALEAIGSTTFTIVLKDALAVFHEDYTPVENDRANLIDEKETFDEKWDILDDRFYEYSEDIHKLLLDYVTNNIDSFR